MLSSGRLMFILINIIGNVWKSIHQPVVLAVSYCCQAVQYIESNLSLTLFPPLPYHVFRRYCQYGQRTCWGEISMHLCALHTSCHADKVMGTQCRNVFCNIFHGLNFLPPLNVGIVYTLLVLLQHSIII